MSSYYHNHEAYLRAAIEHLEDEVEHGRHAGFREQSQTILDRKRKELHKIIVKNELDRILEEELI